MRGLLEKYMPAMSMFMLQFTYAGLALSTKQALLQGMSPRVFIFYRHAIATLVIAPIAYFSRTPSASCSLNSRSFTLIFLASFVGIAINQNVYFEGLYLVPASVASAMTNLIPAVTFVIAALAGMERVNIRSLRSVAKIGGTLICVSGAVSMALIRGPKLLNALHLLPKPFMDSGSDNINWLLGCLCLFGSCCLWSIWLILQVPASASHPNHLSLSAWMCLMGALQSAAVALVLERDLHKWKMNSVLQLGCCLYTGVVGSALSFFVQAWCISKKGPVYAAMFNPLCTVIVTVFAALFLHEEIYTASIIGAVGVIVGLYVVLWGKSEEVADATEEEKGDPKLQIQKTLDVNILIDESFKKANCKIDDDLKEPLLSTKPSSNS